MQSIKKGKKLHWLIDCAKELPGQRNKRDECEAILAREQLEVEGFQVRLMILQSFH